MDPKMDQCYGLQKESNKNRIPSPKEILETASFPENTRPAVYISLLLDLLSRECAFLDGASLSESLMECIYIWPKSWITLREQLSKNCNTTVSHNYFEQAVLLFCKSIVFTLQHIFTGMLASDIYQGKYRKNIS